MTFKHYAKSIRLGLSALAIAVSAQSAFAASAWQINPLGSGLAGASSVSAINVGGVGFVQLLPNGIDSPLFTFIETGVYRALNADGSGPFGANDLTVTYSVSGTGNFLDASALHLNTGSINLYADPNFDFGTSTATYGADNGTKVGSFDIFSGYVAQTGLVTVNANGVAGSILSGYLFNAEGADLATLSNVQLQLSIFNRPIWPVDSMLVSEIICDMAGYKGGGCDGDGTPFIPTQFAFAVQDGGSVTISAVPEPETLTLLLAGLGLIGVVGRRRQKGAC